MRRTAIAILSTALLVTGATARADGGEREYDPRAAHREADRNRDGRIDREEFHEKMLEIFYHADRDKDGFTTLGELQVFNEERVFAVGDRNRDGKLTLYEFIDVRFDDFHEADANADGVLSVDEVVAAFER